MLQHHEFCSNLFIRTISVFGRASEFSKLYFHMLPVSYHAAIFLSFLSPIVLWSYCFSYSRDEFPLCPNRDKDDILDSSAEPQTLRSISCTIPSIELWNQSISSSYVSLSLTHLHDRNFNSINCNWWGLNLP